MDLTDDKTLDEMLSEVKAKGWGWELHSHRWRPDSYYAAVTEEGGGKVSQRSATMIGAVRPLWRFVVLGQP